MKLVSSKLDNKERGQAAVEYLLLLVAVISILFAVFRTLESRIAADPDSCNKGSINPLCFLKGVGIVGDDTISSEKFRTFRLR